MYDCAHHPSLNSHVRNYLIESSVLIQQLHSNTATCK